MIIGRYKALAAILMVGLFQMLASCDNKSAEEVELASEGAQTISQSNELTGEQLFVACQACHALAAGEDHKVGPNLYGILDQPAATREGYRYSEPLKASGLIWNKGSLMGWMVSGERMVPGTWMVYYNQMSPAELERLADYILSYSD